MAHPSQTNGHGQEPTAASLTETFVEHPSSFSKTIETVPSPSSERSAFPSQEQTLDPHATPKTIPPEHPNRTLILCFDGTGDQFDADNSNIVQLFSLLKKDDREKQMVYYQAGIGTYTSPQVATPFMSKISKTLDEMIAWNLDAHVMDGYEFLMQNYTAGDRICIFGFSRGAYTARALAGMIHKVGLLPACNHQQVPFAYKMFSRTDKTGWEQSNAFKQAFSINVDIEFIGVWDTVNSVGLIPKRLPFTTSNTLVRTFRHAVSLDEHRAKFKANLWNRPNAKEEKLGAEPVVPKVAANGAHTVRGHAGDTKLSQSSRIVSTHERKLRDLERMYSNSSTLTDVEEVWFSGCHCDVGGGSVSNTTPNSLARIPLRWMIRECFKTRTGIMFDADRLKAVGLDPATLYPFVTPRPPPLPLGAARVERVPSSSFFRKPSPPVQVATETETGPHAHAQNGELRVGMEEEEELKDAMSPVYDQLEIKWFWWVLEIIPMKLRYQNKKNEWVSELGSNFGRARYIPKQKSNGVRVHRSVKMRMEALYDSGKSKYSPRAKFTVEPTWVD